MTHQLGELVKLDQMRGWERLKVNEQALVERETAKLLIAIQDTGDGRLRIGQHLASIRDVLEPRKLFLAYLRTDGLKVFRMSVASAYRHINNYIRAKTVIPMPIMRLALMRNMEMIDLELVAAHPPPRSQDPEIMSTWLDQVEQTTWTKPSDADAQEILLKEAYHAVRRRFNALPNDHAVRTAWMHELAGLMATMLGVSSGLRAEPRAIPDQFRLKPVGRPPKRKQA